MSEQRTVQPAATERLLSGLYRWVPWLALAMWLATALVGGESITDAIADRSTAVRTVVLVATWAGWAVGALAIAVASTVSLTVARALVPAAIPVGAVSWVAGGDTVPSLLLVVLATATALLVATGEFGAAMVQASAYGDESRVPLRPPLGFLIMSGLSWVLTVLMATSGPLLAAANLDDVNGITVIGLVLTVLAVGMCWFFGRRWHLLSRRWLVFVPAGLVVHDGLVLAETLMLRRTDVASIGLAYADTTALDLTGPATGHMLEVTTRGPTRVVLAGQRRGDAPRPADTAAFLVAPSRPGRALAEATRRRLPTGAHTT